jgi:hypothetical protein
MPYDVTSRAPLYLVKCLLLASAFWGLSVGAQTTTANTDFPSEAKNLAPTALQVRLVGQKFTSRYANGMTVTLQYGTDQAVQLDMSTGLSAKGTWRIDGGQLPQRQHGQDRFDPRGLTGASDPP